jgi:hypothetical protein
MMASTALGKFYCICAMLFVAVAPTFSQTKKASEETPALELTEADLFARPQWVSTQVSVLGIRLAMTRREATEQVRRRGLQLIALDGPLYENPCGQFEECVVCDSQKVFMGIRLVFGSNGKIAGIRLERIRNMGNPAARKVAIQWRLKGNTYRFFNDYSDDLRVKLLGRAPGADSIETGGTQYVYPRLGLRVAIRLFPNSEKDPALRGDTILLVDFIAPTN